MEILAWLLFPLAVTVIAMAWAGWAGRPRRPLDEEDSAEAYDRFAAAVQKPHPGRGKRVAPAPVAPASGVAIRKARPTRPAPTPPAPTPR
ncbi:MAG: hypothetical protein M3Q39_07145 [Actinomycetota bacterium]|nr:hypothetical protein [Actinomycetota bacterium]